MVFGGLGHQLELFLKDALKTTFFCFNWSASLAGVLPVRKKLPPVPKSSQKVSRIGNGGRRTEGCLKPTEIPTKGRNWPLCVCGTRFVAHKVVALGRLVETFGVYLLCHVAAMIEDRSIRSADRQKLKGYLLKWWDAKFLLGCTFFNDLLRLLAILCKVLQEDELCIVRAIKSVFKVKQAMNKVKVVSFEELLTVKKKGLSGTNWTGLLLLTNQWG